MKQVFGLLFVFALSFQVSASDRKKIMGDAQARLAASGISEKARKKGSQYINFTLPDANGKNVSISELLKKSAVVLNFYRGGWCPYCNQQLAEYQARISEISSAGGQLVAVSPEKPSSAQDTVTKSDLEFAVLSDSHNKVARQYGLVFKIENDLKDVYLKMGLDLEKNQGNNSWELPLPATYVISKSGEIVYSFVEVDYKKRASVDDVVEALKALK
ncbi:AhpC/TSA family protein [bacterium]|nr:AhpC/TSA family protein [bacterium]